MTAPAFLTLTEAAKFIPGADANTLKRMHRAGRTTISVSKETVAEIFFREWVSHARGRAKKRGVSFDLTAGFLVNTIVEQNFKCAVSGLELEFKTAFRSEYRRHPFIASVDRIDNDRGYEPGNVRIVCLIVNLARSDFGDEVLLKMARAIVLANL